MKLKLQQVSHSHLQTLRATSLTTRLLSHLSQSVTMLSSPTIAKLSAQLKVSIRAQVEPQTSSLTTQKSMLCVTQFKQHLKCIVAVFNPQPYRHNVLLSAQLPSSVILTQLALAIKDQ